LKVRDSAGRLGHVAHAPEHGGHELLVVQSSSGPFLVQKRKEERAPLSIIGSLFKEWKRELVTSAPFLPVQAGSS
jgi:hypothetical protein